MSLMRMMRTLPPTNSAEAPLLARMLLAEQGLQKPRLWATGPLVLA